MRFNKYFPKILISCLTLCVTIGVIVSIFHGNSIGYLNSLIVFGAFLVCGIIVIFVELIYILIKTIYKSHSLKSTTIDHNQLDEANNFYEPFKPLTKHEELQRTFDNILLKCKHDSIIGSTAEEDARKRVKKIYVVQYSELIMDLFMFLLYLVILTLVVLSTRDSITFYSTRFAVKQFVNGRYGSGEIIQIETFYDYLRNDFLPAIHRTGYTSASIAKKMFWVYWYKNIKMGFCIERINQTSSNGYLIDKHIKVLGVARLRQQRVRKDSCTSPELINSRHKCLPLLDRNTEDKKNYDPLWKPKTNVYASEKYWRILQPWQYQNSLQSQTIHQFGKIMLYSGGGYIVNLGRTMRNSMSIVEFIRKYKWIDRQTRIIFIEFTTYGVDANIFNVITLIAEQTVIGYFELSYNIQSVGLLTIIEHLSGKTIFIFMIFLLLIFLFICRITLKLLDSNWKAYFSKPWNIIDLITVIQSLGFVMLFLLRNQYVESLLDLLEDKRNNEFVSFIFAAFVHQFMLWWAGVLVCISTIRLWKILNFILIFRVFSLTLIRSAKDLFATTLVTFLFIICFGMLEYHMKSSDSKSFSILFKSFTSLIAILFGFVNDDINSGDIVSGKNWIETFFYVTSLVVVAIYLINMIITVVCLYFSAVREETELMEKSEYSFWDFLREEYYQIFKSKQKSINAASNSRIKNIERVQLLDARLDFTMKSLEELFNVVTNK